MDNKQAFEFLSGYFEELFTKRNIAALDNYLAADYFDEDIGDESENHLENSKVFLKNLFLEKPHINVKVCDARIRDDVITAYLEWYENAEDIKVVLKRGLGIFEVDGNLIKRRHTYIYDPKR